MRRKNKILCIFSVLFTMLFSFIQPVNAERYAGYRISPEESIPGVYWVKQATGYSRPQYRTGHFMRRSSDGEFVYCIQPMADIDNNYVYNIARSDYELVTNLTLEQLRRITLLSYYGYKYGNHTDPKWYAVTQMLIWRTIDPTGSFYFTDGNGGSIIYDKFSDEMAELERLVEDHYRRPKFNQENIVIPLGQTITLTDENNLLSGFTIYSQNNVNASVNGNSMFITATGIGDANITLSKTDNMYSTPPLVYFNDHSQDVFRVGSYDPISFDLNLKVIGGRVEITKKDKDTGEIIPKGQATLKNATYGVYKASTNELITTITTDENAYAISDYLPELGNFYLQEITPSVGYTLDKEKYYFTLTEDNPLFHIDVYEKVIERKYEITKVYASNKTGILTPEIGTDFGIYDHEDNLLLTLTTDLEGKIYFTLPYGHYTLRQLTSPSGVEKIEDYHFTIRDLGEEVNIAFADAEVSSRIKVIKVDQDGNNIPIAGIKFRIKDLSNNDYICHKVIYPNEVNYCEFETNEEGIITTPFILSRGSYQLEEVDQFILGYTWNKTPLKFTIDGDSDIKDSGEFDKILELYFTNNEVKGIIEINKIGEKLVIENGNYKYEEIPLLNVVFGLYDENKTLITTLTTNENGYAKIENLKLGKYFLKEISTNDNHILDTKEYEINLEYKDQYTPIVSKTFTLKNYIGKGQLEFSKTDLTTGKEIAGVKVEIYTENDELIFTGITDENGKIKVKDLFVGKFYIVETEPLTGYKLNDEKVYFEIKENGEVVKSNMTNEKFKGELEFTKVDISTGEPLPNTLIEIYTIDNQLIFSGRTDENGKITIKDLEYGKYYILEKEAPSGYTLNTEKMYFEILEDGSIVKATMTNEKIVEVPNTGLNDSKIVEIVGIVLIILGVGYLFYDKNKKK